MPFLPKEDMQARLNELTNPETEESRKVEIISELGQQHVSGWSDIEVMEQEKDKLNKELRESQSAMATMYGQLNAQTFGGSDGTPKQPDFQETVTIEDLINR